MLRLWLYSPFSTILRGSRGFLFSVSSFPLFLSLPLSLSSGAGLICVCWPLGEGGGVSGLCAALASLIISGRLSGDPPPPPLYLPLSYSSSFSSPQPLGLPRSAAEMSAQIWVLMQIIISIIFLHLWPLCRGNSAFLLCQVAQGSEAAVGGGKCLTWSQMV